MEQKKEMEVVELMIRLYCKKHHGTKGKELCPECKEVLEYVKFRRSKCPWGDDKPFCANCVIHCYKPEMREKIRAIMRYSGPRMITSHPVLAMKHLIETKQQKKKIEKYGIEKLKAEGLAKLAEKRKAEAAAKAEAEEAAKATEANKVTETDSPVVEKKED